MKTINKICGLKFNLLLCLLVALVLSTSLQAQAPAIEWEKSFGGTGSDVAVDIDLTSDGGYVTVGYSNSDDGDVTGNHGSYDFWVIKMNSTGNLEWQKSLGGSQEDYGQSIEQTQDGGYIVGGYTKSNDGDVSGNNGQTDSWAVKLDASGNIQWQNAMGGSNVELGREIRQTSDGGYIMIGVTNSINGDVSGNHGSHDYWVVKLSSSGTIQWQKALGGTLYDEGMSIQLTSDGGYIVAGHSHSSDGDITTGNQGIRDFWIVKLDGNGNIQWNNTMGGSASDNVRGIIQTAEGGYIVYGHTFSIDGDITVNQGLSDSWLVKLDPLGVMEWQKTLGGSLDDFANSVQQTADGGFVIAGFTSSNDGDVSGNHGARDLWVVKIDGSGNVLWQKAIGTIDVEEGNSIALTVDGGYIIAGHKGNDFWIVKLAPDPLEVPEFDGNKIVLYPNPVKDILHIEASEEINRIRIYTILGQTVYDEIHKGTLINLNTEHFSEGLYMVEIIVGNHSEIYEILKQ